MPIFINTDNSDKKNKIYNAKLVGSRLDDAEAKMKEMVIKAFENDAEFTTNKIDDPKGYTLMFEVTKFEGTDRDASCTISGEIIRYPKSVSHSKKAQKGKGSEKVMIGGDWSISSAVSGKNSIVRCVEEVMKVLVPKSKTVMKADFARR